MRKVTMLNPDTSPADSCVRLTLPVLPKKLGLREISGTIYLPETIARPTHGQGHASAGSGSIYL